MRKKKQIFCFCKFKINNLLHVHRLSVLAVANIENMDYIPNYKQPLSEMKRIKKRDIASVDIMISTSSQLSHVALNPFHVAFYIY